MARRRLFTRARAANRAEARVLNTDRRADFRMANAGLNAIFGNAATTQAALGRDLSAASRRTLAAMERLAGRSTRAVNADVRGGRTEAGDLFGIAGSAGAAQELVSAKGAAKANALESAAAARAGKGLRRAGGAAMDIIGAGTTEAQAAADFALAQALGYRAREDASLIAERKANTAAQLLDARLNERYLRLQNRLSTESGGGSAAFQNAAGMLQEAAQGGASTQELQRLAESLRYQFNLGPEAQARLASMLSALSGGASGAGAEGGVISSASSQAFTDQYGYSPSAALGADFEAATNRAAQAWARKHGTGKEPGVPDVLDAIGVEQNSEGKFISIQSGAEVSEQQVMAAVAYFLTTFARIKAREDADAAPTPNGGNNNTPSETG